MSAVECRPGEPFPPLIRAAVRYAVTDTFTAIIGEVSAVGEDRPDRPWEGIAGTSYQGDRQERQRSGQGGHLCRPLGHHQRHCHQAGREWHRAGKVITSIAEQTNVLALNATFEAGRASEAGKGFAVVANEVKELAQETAKATEDISQKIEAIQTDTKGTVEAIQQIGAIINQMNDISNSIASAVEEQTATSNEIGRNVAEAAKGSGEIAQNITALSQAATSTTEGASNSHKAAAELSRRATELQQWVGRFQYDRPGDASASGSRPDTNPNGPQNHQARRKTSA
jgi:hypothetical protein